MSKSHAPDSLVGQPGSLVGRVVRTEVLKHLTFVWCWRPPDVVQCVLPHGVGSRPRVGAFARLSGRYRPYGGHRADCLPVELVTERIDILATPAVQRPGQGLDGIGRSRALFGRAVAVSTAQTFLTSAGLLRVETPLVVGAEAASGATTPFRLCAGQQHAFLTVNGVTGLHEYLAAGLSRVFQLSRLYWGHHSSDRSFLTEINLVEFALAGAGRQGVIALTERLIEAVRLELARTVALGDPAVLGRSLAGLPVLSHAELIERTGAVGAESRHVVPQVAVRAAFDALDVPGFWLVDPPASTTPHYARMQQRPDGSRSVAVDLHLAGVGETASGSEWITDPAEARSATADWPDAASGYLAAVDRGIPPATAAMSLGVDRLIMYLLGRPQVTAVVPAARNSTTFRTAPRLVPAPSRAVEPARPAIDAAPSVADASRRVSRAVGWLLAEGFAGCMTSLLAEPWTELLADGLPVVDYFGRRVGLVPGREPGHHRHLAECPTPIFELGPVARGGSRWAAPTWTLSASWIDPDREQLRMVAERLIGLLAERTGAIGSPVAGGLDMTPLSPGRAGYFRGSLTGNGLNAMAWFLGGHRVAWAGTWITGEEDLPDALGEGAASDRVGPLRQFLRTAPPPAGGVTVDLTALPGLEWPSFAAHPGVNAHPG